MLRRRIAQPIRARRKHPTIAPAKRLTRESRLAVRDQRHGARREELVAGALELVRVDCEPRGSASHSACSASPRVNVAAWRVSPSGPARWSIAACQSRVSSKVAAAIARPPDPTPAPRTQRLRPSAPLPRQRLRDNARIFRTARRQRGGLRGPSARRAALCKRRVDLGLPPAERARTMPRDTRHLRDPAPHDRPSTPIVRVSSLRSTAWYRKLAVRASAYSRRPSSADHRPSIPRPRFATKTWVCSCGSPAREVRWRNAAATKPRRLLDDRARVAAPNGRGRSLEVPNRLQRSYIMSFTYKIA